MIIKNTTLFILNFHFSEIHTTIIEKTIIFIKFVYMLQDYSFISRYVDKS